MGDEDWKRFFALMGSVLALKEKRPTVPGTPADKAQLIGELRQLIKHLRIETVLGGWNAAVNIMTPKMKDAHAFLLILDLKEMMIRVKGFELEELPAASEECLQVEKENTNNPDIQAVLVSVSSIAALRSAYPNYYLDTTTFVNEVRKAIA